ncbi:MAG: Mrp/NBP35 family ATP-binding protein [Ruminiclostridium sp.]|nr:Mrp/NBP35 family ATP-binding protein [Ruminiclostridium sp.]
MNECTHNCSTCSSNCSERKAESLLAPQNELSNVKKVIAVVSGKGGVGKSLVTSLLASVSAKKGNKTAVLDADITGPSIPKVFGVSGRVMSDGQNMIPLKSKNGIEIMSVNLLLENDTDPVVWRGPVIAGVVKQFWSDVVWDDIDFMFVDMPPGTGDVPLTVFQSIPVSGIIVVTSPQELVSMIVEKAVKMADMMNIPVLGIVENMSYFVCDNCDKKHYIYGESRIDEIAAKHGIKNIAKLPIDPSFAAYGDKGDIESADTSALEAMAEELLK